LFAEVGDVGFVLVCRADLAQRVGERVLRPMQQAEIVRQVHFTFLPSVREQRPA
jgi:hypothetical protein